MVLSITQRQVKNQFYDELLAEGLLSLRMMRIPAGKFLMGSPEAELERTQVEGPQYEVSVPQFFMAKYPVTQAQWRVVAAMPQIKRELKSAPSDFQGNLNPVETVSWLDAVEFCDRLTIATNRQYRLPTEAEWEYACRAGTTTPFHFGETLSTEYANYDGADKDDGVYGPGSQGEYRESTTPVTQFDCANAYGLCDMHGNVWEWCADHWHDNYEGAPVDGSAWVTDDEKAYRVRRGGSWFDYPRICRSASRGSFTPEYRYVGIGCRVSCAAPRTP